MIAAGWFFAAWLVAGFVTGWVFGSAARLGDLQDPRVLFTRRVLRVSTTIVAAVAALILLSGCATPGTITLGPLWAPKLTPAEQVEAERIELAIDRLCAEELKTTGHPCVKPHVSVLDRDVTATYSPAYNSLTLPRRALGADAGFWRAIVAHELGHWMFPDARLQGDLVQAERNANAHAVWILMAGFDYTERDAIVAVWRYLVSGVLTHPKPTKGHPDACAEAHDFEKRAGIAPPYDCTELVAAQGGTR